MNSKSLIKETNRRVVSAHNHEGTCNACGSPVYYDGEIIGVQIEETDDRYIIVPIDILSCPYCYKAIGVMYVYKDESLKVSV